MDKWLHAKMESLTDEFLSGLGVGWVYEAQYLAYLECYVFARFDQAHTFWIDYAEYQKAQTPEGQPPSQLAHHLDGSDLVNALRQFRRRYEGPRKANFVVPPSKKPVIEVPPDQTEMALGLFDLLGGEP